MGPMSSDASRKGPFARGKANADRPGAGRASVLLVGSVIAPVIAPVLAVFFAILVALAGALPGAISPAHAFVEEVVAADRLPAEARETLALIRRGGPFPHAKDGTVFQNREGLLPRRPRGHYTEYTVRTPGARNRGARRIVAGGDPASTTEFWYTEDHYRSFRRIRE